MPALQVEFNRHLNVCQSVPLLLQFSLSEFFQVYRLFQNIQKLVEEEQFNNRLTTQLARFSGLSPERSKVFYWSPDNSCLAKLCYYATFLEDHAQSLFPHFPPVEKSCRKCWMFGSHLFEAIDDQKYVSGEIILGKLQRSLRQVAKELIKAITLLKENENVLFFLLRHNAQIDIIYGSCFTMKLIAGLFPGGLNEAKTYLIDKYADRGFDKLSETICQHFNEIQ